MVAPEKLEFVEQKRFALVGVSRSRGFGNEAMKELRRRGYEVLPVNANADEIAGEKCYRSLDALPGPVDGAVVVVPPAQAAGVVADCARAGIRRVWLQQGAQSPEAIELARKHGIAVVHDACILMHARPTSIHRFHAWLWKKLGRL